MAKGFKTGGRKKGTPNYTTKELRGVLANFVSWEVNNLYTTFAEIPTKDRSEILIKLLPYVLPKPEEKKEEEDEDGPLPIL